ncbi:MAG: hypothetical protein J1F60_09575 [Oscillospiraceae bacterium]|nr:hypothetical protein [Oscillospiraceae bacterium]
MEKFEKMVKQNQAESREKISSAIAAIIEMEQAGERVQICELTKRTGLSRGFFYKNAAVRKELDRALELQRGMTFTNPRKAVLDVAMEKQIALLTKQVEKQKKQIAELEAENKKLKKALDRKELAFLKQL